jgi:transmembrane sensor
MKDLEPDERKWYLAARKLTDTLTQTEEIEWQSLIADDQFRKEFEFVSTHFNNLQQLPYSQINKEKDWSVILEQIRSQQPYQRRFPFSPLLRYAAAIAFFLLTSFLIWKFATSGADQSALITVEAPIGARTSVRLPDGSVVWLNAASKISFRKDFGSNNRDVTLSGEAFFDVKKDNVTFSVNTPAYNITVLGTAFNVRAYDEDATSTTTLLRGSLKVNYVNAAGKAQNFLLEPNEKFVLYKTDQQKPAIEKDIDAMGEAEWKDGWLTARGESLSELSKKIERLYNVKFKFEDDTLKSYRYTGRIQQLSLEQVLKALELTSPVAFSIQENTVTLRINQAARQKYKAIIP